MNKTALKKFATEARRELLERVELQARKIGITEDAITKADVESSDAVFIDGRQLSDIERRQRNKLIARIKEIGFKRVMEETAYTWFNRFIALRFMEVNDYLPTKVRVLSSLDPDRAEPDMMKEALNLDLDMDKEYVYDLKMNNKTDEMFKYLIKVHCNDLNRYMPFMFETVEDYKEILFPEGLLGKDTFLRKLTDTNEISEDDWTNIEIIGWLYQFYISEEKDRVFKEKKKYKAEEIPFATQLFTPDWIVRYMVQNSLGRYWTEAHPEHNDLKDNWEFFIEHQEEDFQEKIAPYVNNELNVEEIKCFDPAMGSGHILVYMFDVLYEIYNKCGYMEREIPRLIIEKNLYGLDIDDRAYQLACFSIVMKALQYNRRFLRSIEREGLILNLASIQETNNWSDEVISYIAGEEKVELFDKTKAFFEQYKNAKTFGSLIKISEKDTTFLENRLEEIKENPVTDIFDEEKREQVLDLLPLLIKQTKIMGQQYNVVVMNPPYMGSGNMNELLKDFLNRYYPDSKTNLFAPFMEIDHFLSKNGFYAAINQQSWMFITTFEKLRDKIINNKFIDSMLHLGARAFEEIGGEVVQTTTFVLRNIKLNVNQYGKYIRLVNENTPIEKKNRAIKTINNFSSLYFFKFLQQNFNKIPGKPIAYWVSNRFIKNFINGKSMDEISTSMVAGNKTAKNEKYLRYIWEISSLKVNKKWFLYAKGGEYRKWYGNIENVIDWSDEAKTFYKTNKSSNIIKEEYWFKEGLTYTDLTSKDFNCRLLRKDMLFDMSGPGILFENQNLYYVMGILNSKIANEYFRTLNTTFHYKLNDVNRIPIIINEEFRYEIEDLVKNNIIISKNDWDSFETSFEFKTHPVVNYAKKTNFIKEAYIFWSEFLDTQLFKLKSNEERLNQIISEIYGLKDEISIEIEELSIRKPDLLKDIKSFISYAIGCMFGRYSLNEEGLIYAGGEFDATRYKTFPIDEDNVVPILSSSYFEDDIVSRFVDFVRITFSEETLEENLEFIADVLGRKGNETARETLRRYFLNDFYKDHLQTYKKLPIYWLFTSGKEKAFNCLIYMHRYDKTTLSCIRADYLHEVQTRMEAEKLQLLEIIEGDFTAKEITKAKKELKALEKKIDELKAYDELLHHKADMQIEIDLDDGVKVNYEMFKGLVAPIK